MSAIIQGGGDVFGPIGVADGDLAIFNGTTGKIIESGGTSSGLLIGDVSQTGRPSGSIVVPAFANHPDRAFTNPTAFDDHFDGGSLDPKWVASYATGGSANQVIAMGGSCVNLQGVSSIGADGLQYGVTLTQNLPAGAGASDFTVTLKAQSLTIPNNATGSVAHFDVGCRSATPSVQGVLLRLRNAFLAGVGQSKSLQSLTGLNSATTDATYFMSIPEYIRFVWTRATLRMDVYFSTNGVTYFLFRGYLSATSGLTASILPQNINISTNSINFGRSQVAIDWITFTAP